MPLGGGREGRGVPTPGGTLRGSDQWGVGPAFPLPNRPGKSAQLSGQVLCPQRSPLGWVGPGGIGGRLGENKRGRREGSSRTGGAGKEQRAFAPATWAQGACWATGWGPLPSETRGRRHAWVPSVLLSLSPTPFTPRPTLPPPPLPTLWVLSIGPTHHPNLTPA